MLIHWGSNFLQSPLSQWAKNGQMCFQKLLFFTSHWSLQILMLKHTQNVDFSFWGKNSSPPELHFLHKLCLICLLENGSRKRLRDLETKNFFKSVLIRKLESLIFHIEHFAYLMPRLRKIWVVLSSWFLISTWCVFLNIATISTKQLSK